MLLVLLRTVMTAREREDQGVITLYFAELPQSARVVGQLIVGESLPGTMSERICALLQ